MKITRFFRKIFHSLSLQVKKFTYRFKSPSLVGFVFKLNFSLRIYSLQFWRKRKLKPMFLKSWGMKKGEAEKKKQVEMLPTWLLMEGRIGEEIQFFFHPINLRSWFSDFKNVSFKLSYFSSFCASFKLQFFPMAHIFSMGLTWVTYSNCDLGFIYNELKFYCGSWGF